MTRLLFIVARDQPGLLEFLQRDFAAEEAQGDVEIFMDRRESSRGRVVQPHEAKRRDPNRNWGVHASLRDMGCAFVPRQAPLPQGWCPSKQ
jgi:hypothetical protein